MKTKLSNGTTGFFREDGTWQCTGSRMGRSNAIPDPSAAPKFSMGKLRMTDGGAYDFRGAYWGISPVGASLYWATGDAEDVDESYEVFVRARSREEAKAAVLKLIPAARFYR